MPGSAEERTTMPRFSSSRDVLYSAPPGPDGEDEADAEERADDESGVDSPDGAASED